MWSPWHCARPQTTKALWFAQSEMGEAPHYLEVRVNKINTFKIRIYDKQTWNWRNFVSFLMPETWFSCQFCYNAFVCFFFATFWCLACAFIMRSLMSLLVMISWKFYLKKKKLSSGAKVRLHSFIRILKYSSIHSHKR